jgi:hypothetical protein
MRSEKSVKPAGTFIKTKLFIIPKECANDTRKDLKPCVRVTVNSVLYELLVEEPIEIPYTAFCVLQDNGFFSKYTIEDVSGEIDPVRKYET